MPKPKQWPLVLIEWEDAKGVAVDWERIGDDLNPSVIICKSVGWLIHDDDKCKVIVPHLTSHDHGCGDMTIPTAVVVKMIRLKEPKTKRWTEQRSGE